MERVADWWAVIPRALTWNLRQQLLLFDRIAIPDLDIAVEGGLVAPPEQGHDLVALRERGTIFDPGTTIVDADLEVRKAFERVRLKMRSFPGPDVMFDRSDITADGWRHLNEFVDLSDNYDEVVVRSIAPILRGINGRHVVPMCRRPTSLPPELVDRRQNVLHLILSGIPAPDANQPLEELLRFREDTTKLRLRLRRWIGSIARTDFSLPEIADEMEALASDYSTALEVAKMKRETTVIETILTPAEGGWAEYIPRVAAKLFNVRHAQIDLMKEELTMPGREVAYIVKAREAFGK